MTTPAPSAGDAVRRITVLGWLDPIRLLIDARRPHGEGPSRTGRATSGT